MATHDDILLAIGRIEGKLEAYATLSQRVSNLERWQAWLKGGLGRIRRDLCVAVSRFVLEVSDAAIYRSTPVLDCGGDVLDSIRRNLRFA